LKKEHGNVSVWRVGVLSNLTCIWVVFTHYPNTKEDYVMTERTITVITDDGVETHTEASEASDANEQLDKLELTPTKFVQEVVRKLKDNTKD